MPVIITITNDLITFDGSSIFYNYSDYDRILKNVLNNEFEVFYSGQNKGKIDHQLISAVQNKELFKIYYRKKKNISYTYLGSTNISSIIQYRKLPINFNTSFDQRLQIHLIVKDEINSQVLPINLSGSGKFKKDVLYHAGLRDIENNVIIPHNNNTNIGFYYYTE